MRYLVAAIVLLTGCSSEPAAPAEKEIAANLTKVNAEAPADGPTFSSIGELTLPDEIQPELRGGRVADPQQWQASFYTRSAGGSCTASIVGDRVLLTAAHCVANGATVTLRRAGELYRAACEHSPDYSKTGVGRTADYALCAVDRALPGVPAERVNQDASALSVGKEVLLTGFGCTNNQGTGGNDGVYRIGETRIVALPASTNNDITTSGGAGVCFGDSGGPAFLVGPGNSRRQISVNSRVENRSPTGTDLGPRSFLSSLSSPQAKRFLADWSTRNKLRICGLDPQATTCRP